MLVGVEIVTVVALLLAAVAVVGSFVPLLPGAILSLAGVGLYWLATGEPGPVVLAALVIVGVATIVVDWFGGAVAAKAGGASTGVAIAAGVIGLVGLVLGGPVGLFAGVAGTVFLVEYARGGDSEASFRAALVTTVGLLATNVVQAVLTFLIFVSLLLVVVL